VCKLKTFLVCLIMSYHEDPRLGLSATVYWILAIN
jgi:hypothetical protein